MAELVEGKTGTAPDGTRVIVRGGKIVPLTSALGGASPAAPGSAFFNEAPAGKLAVQDNIRLGKFAAQAKSAQGLRTDANRFAALNRGRATGPGYRVPLVKPVMEFIDPGVSEMRAISEKLTPAMREAGSGAMSDKDVEMYRAATVGIEKPGDANVAIAKAIDAGATRESDYAAFMDEWARRKGGLVGAQEAWDSYAEANPLYKDTGKGALAINPWTPWRKWFGVEQGGGQGSAVPQQSKPAAAPKSRPPLSAFAR